MSLEGYSTSESLMESEMNELIQINKSIEKELAKEVESNQIHYSKLDSQSLNNLKELQTQKINSFEDNLKMLCYETVDAVYKERVIKEILKYCTSDATITYRGKGIYVRDMPVKDFLQAVSTGDINMNEFLNSGARLLNNSFRFWSPLLETEVLNTPNGKEIAYIAKLSSMTIWGRASSDGAIGNRDTWDTGEVMTK